MVMLKEKKTLFREKTKQKKHDGTEHKVALCMLRLTLWCYFVTTCAIPIY